MRDRRTVLVACLATLFAPLRTAIAGPRLGQGSPGSGPGPEVRSPRQEPPRYRDAFQRRLAANAPPNDPKATEGERPRSPLPRQAEKNPPDWP